MRCFRLGTWMPLMSLPVSCAAPPQRPSIRHYERARITKVQKKGGRLLVRLNSGGREEQLFATPRTQQGHWAAGVHSAHFSLRAPPAAKTGAYRFRAWVAQGGREEAREALFEVRGAEGPM